MLFIYYCVVHFGLGGTRTRNLDRYERCVLPIELQDQIYNYAPDGNRTRVLALKKPRPTTRRREHNYKYYLVKSRLFAHLNMKDHYLKLCLEHHYLMDIDKSTNYYNQINFIKTQHTSTKMIRIITISKLILNRNL